MKTPDQTRQYRSFFWLGNAKSRHNLLLAALCSLGLVLASCGDNSTGPGENGNGGNGGNGGEPPNEPTYANVESIFSSSCATSGCHDSSTQRSGVDLSSYDSTINSVGDQYGKKVVIPDSAAESPLVDKIEANPEIGARMPQGGSPLSDDQINLIKEWINNGANDDSDDGGGNTDPGY